MCVCDRILLMTHTRRGLYWWGPPPPTLKQANPIVVCERVTHNAARVGECNQCDQNVESRDSLPPHIFHTLSTLSLWDSIDLFLIFSFGSIDTKVFVLLALSNWRYKSPVTPTLFRSHLSLSLSRWHSPDLNLESVLTSLVFINTSFQLSVLGFAFSLSRWMVSNILSHRCPGMRSHRNVFYKWISTFKRTLFSSLNHSSWNISFLFVLTVTDRGSSFALRSRWALCLCKVLNLKIDQFYLPKKARE